MGRFKFEKSKIEGLTIITAEPYVDSRGFFVETYNKEDFEKAGLNMKFVQTNESQSTKGVLRGLHFQKKFPQGKLVRCVLGAVFDVAVDLRKGSRTFGEWVGVELTEDNFKEFYIPEGFAHGFYVMSEVAKFQYKVTNFYNANDEGAVIWNDSEIGIEWPIKEGEQPILSSKDLNNPKLSELVE